MNKKDFAAIVIPLSNRQNLTTSEKVSLRHVEYYLAKYDKYFIAPRTLDFHFDGFGIKRFENHYFGSSQAHCRLLLSRKFYEQFLDYEFILFYHLDCLVFSDQLDYWCQKDYDYIAPPWIKSPDLPWLNSEAVGNGGFSLRRVSSFLKVLESKRNWIDYDKYWHEQWGKRSWYLQVLTLPKKYMKRFGFQNRIKNHIEHYINNKENEDRFWAHEAVKYYPEFKIAPVDIAIKFAFEAAPRKCFERNQQKLPFGCHAWEKYDKEFWKPYLLSEQVV